jgi:hypothetical protein
MTAHKAREVLSQVDLFDGEALPGVLWPATDAAVQWLATHLREALATIIARDEGTADAVRTELAAIFADPSERP